MWCARDGSPAPGWASPGSGVRVERKRGRRPAQPEPRHAEPRARRWPSGRCGGRQWLPGSRRLGLPVPGSTPLDHTPQRPTSGPVGHRGAEQKSGLPFGAHGSRRRLLFFSHERSTAAVCWPPTTKRRPRWRLLTAGDRRRLSWGHGGDHRPEGGAYPGGGIQTAPSHPEGLEDPRGAP